MFPKDTARHRHVPSVGVQLPASISLAIVVHPSSVRASEDSPTERDSRVNSPGNGAQPIDAATFNKPQGLRFVPHPAAPLTMCGACLGRGTPFVVPMGQCRFCSGIGSVALDAVP